MPTQEQIQRWVNGYRTAWESNDPTDIGRLFAEHGVYYTEPYAEPWRGRQSIIDNWIRNKDEPGDTEFNWRTLATDGALAVVQGDTRYRDPAQHYSNLWVIRMDSDGRATEFTEWWMLHRQHDG